MQTIILAAGNNERFDGVHKSKLADKKGKPFIEYQVRNYDSDPLVFIAQKKYADKLRSTVANLSLTKKKARTIVHVWLEQETAGPLDTLCRAENVLQFIQDDKPVLISYCDVLLSEELTQQFVQACNERSMGILLFESDNTRFQADDTGYKKSGLFFFQSGYRLKKMISAVPDEMRLPEHGIADMMYRYEVPVAFICNDVVDIGTPEDYKEWYDRTN